MGSLLKLEFAGALLAEIKEQTLDLGRKGRVEVTRELILADTLIFAISRKKLTNSYFDCFSYIKE